MFDKSNGNGTGLAELILEQNFPTADWTDAGREEHFVQYYEDSEFLVNCIAEYLFHALKSSQSCVFIATREHIAATEPLLKSFGCELETARTDGRYVALDAHEMLAKVMVNGMPDEKRFAAVVGGQLRKTAKLRRPIRAYGEMVSILCGENNFAGAIRLERLWNELKKKVKFSLFCTYSMRHLTNPTASEHIRAICDNHSRVIPCEDYTSLTTPQERMKNIVFLQQRIAQLEAEVDAMNAGKHSNGTAAKSRR